MMLPDGQPKRFSLIVPLVVGLGLGVAIARASLATTIGTHDVALVLYGAALLGVAAIQSGLLASVARLVESVREIEAEPDVEDLAGELLTVEAAPPANVTNITNNYYGAPPEAPPTIINDLTITSEQEPSRVARELTRALAPIEKVPGPYSGD